MPKLTNTPQHLSPEQQARKEALIEIGALLSGAQSIGPDPSTWRTWDGATWNAVYVPAMLAPYTLQRGSPSAWPNVLRQYDHPRTGCRMPRYARQRLRAGI